jgi:hypothetical protein
VDCLRLEPLMVRASDMLALQIDWGRCGDERRSGEIAT